MALADDAGDEAAAAGLESTPALGLAGVPSPAPGAPDPGAALEPPPDGTAGDDLWARTFGAGDVAPYPRAIAVRGDELFVGGDFTLQMAGMPDETYVRVAHWDG